MESKQVVAIKVLNLDTAEDDIRDVQQEISLLSQLALSDAQNVTRYHGSFLNGSKLWIIMDYCSGGSVRTLLKAGKIEEKYSSVITRELLVALVYIHKEGIIHRDIKAANVLVTKEGRVQLCDFGVAAQLSNVQLKRTSMIGTPYWMAPEVIQEGTPYNQKADVWSLGITLFEIATGSPPFSDQELKRAVYLIPRSKPARLEGTQYSQALKEFVAKCLDEQPEERATAEELSKTRFIKNTRNVPTFIIRDLIARYTQWRENNKSARDSFLMPDNGGAELYSDDEEDNPDPHDFWDFEDMPPPQHPFPLTNPAIPFAENTISQSQFSGHQTGTLMANNGIVSNHSTANYANTAVPNGVSSQTPTYRVPERSEEEKHPLMELFETETESETQEANDHLPPLMPHSANPSSVNLNGLTSMQDYSSPIISLDMPPVGQPYAPVEIEIPSFDALDPPRKLSQPALSLAGHPVSSASTPNLPDLGASKPRMGSVAAASSAISPIVTPHTPIKPVFSQTNLSMYNNNNNNNNNNSNISSPIATNPPPNPLQHQKLTPHNTTKPSVGRTPSPKRATAPKVSPMSINPPPTKATPSSSQTTLKSATLQSSMDSTTEVEDQGSFDFSGHHLAQPDNRALSKTSSSASLKELQDKSQKPTKRQNLFLAMPPSTFAPSGTQSPGVLQAPATLTTPFNGSGGGSAASQYAEQPSEQPVITQQQILYKQQLMQQQQKQGPVALSLALPKNQSSSAVTGDRVPPPRSLTSQRQFIQKHMKKPSKPLKEPTGKPVDMRQHRQGSSISGPGGGTSGFFNKRFPKLVELDSNVLLDGTPKEESVAHFDTLLACFESSLAAIEQDLSLNYL